VSEIAEHADHTRIAKSLLAAIANGECRESDVAATAAVAQVHAAVALVAAVREQTEVMRRAEPRFVELPGIGRESFVVNTADVGLITPDCRVAERCWLLRRADAEGSEQCIKLPYDEALRRLHIEPEREGEAK
jgi:hypothetical protein